jgi:hypothetical protein
MPDPNGGVLQDLLEASFSFYEILLSQIGIAEVAAGQEENLFWRTISGQHALIPPQLLSQKSDSG